MSYYTHINIGDFINMIKELDNEYLITLKKECDNIYSNSEIGEQSLLSDEQYDLLKDYLLDNSIIEDTIGCDVGNNGQKVRTPFGLASLDKATTYEKLNKWFKKNPYDMVRECKLDGVSCLVEFNKNNSVKMYTRGDGTHGCDISNLTEYINGISNCISDKLFVRGELIIEKEVFESKWSGKYANARNMVSGCVNSKKINKGLSDINFVAYEVISESCLSPSEQKKLLESNGFETVDWSIVNNELNFENECEHLKHMKNEYKYEIDGIVFKVDKSYLHDSSKNPDNAIAFKQQCKSNVKYTTVLDVIWKPSKWGYMKPRVQFVPVSIDGVTISFATAYNARFVKNNRLGKNSKISVERSGDVIPKIIEVFGPSEYYELPQNCTWNETKVELILNDTSSISNIKMVEDFFNKLGCKNVGGKIIEKFFSNGYPDIFSIIDADISDIIEFEGFKEKLSNTVYNSIRDGVQKASIQDLISSSSVFGMGFGRKKVDLIFKELPNILNMKDNIETVNKISNIKGFSQDSAELVSKRIQEARCFIEKINIRKTSPLDFSVNNISEKSKCKLFSVCPSGFRFESKIISEFTRLNVVICDSVTKDIDYVIVKVDDYKKTTKTKKAESLGIEILKLDLFMEMILT